MAKKGLTPIAALRSMIRATDAVLDEVQAHAVCPCCPANDERPHRRGCELVKLLRAREDAGVVSSSFRANVQHSGEQK